MSGIKTKPKGGMSNFINGESDKVKNMSDQDLKTAVHRNMYPNGNKKAEELLDETVNRKWKKQGGYADGTKGIKTTKKSTIAQDDARNEKEKPSKGAFEDGPSAKELEVKNSKGIKVKKKV